MGGQVWSSARKLLSPLPLDYQGLLLHLAYKATLTLLFWFRRFSLATTWSPRHFSRRIQLVITILMQKGTDEVTAINFVKDSEEELREVTPLNTKIIARDQREAKTSCCCTQFKCWRRLTKVFLIQHTKCKLLFFSGKWNRRGGAKIICSKFQTGEKFLFMWFPCGMISFVKGWSRKGFTKRFRRNISECYATIC